MRPQRYRVDEPALSCADQSEGVLPANQAPCQLTVQFGGVVSLGVHGAARTVAVYARARIGHRMLGSGQATQPPRHVIDPLAGRDLALLIGMEERVIDLDLRGEDRTVERPVP